MAYPYARQLDFPLDEYVVNSYPFGEHIHYQGVDWGIHLGEDTNRPAGTHVKAIGRGRVVYVAQHSEPKGKGNWGNIIIVAHKDPTTKKAFFSLYAHLDKARVQKGDPVERGSILAVIGAANSKANGYWPEEHLHLAIYTGPWKGKVLPGYYKPEQKRTHLEDWHEPTSFISNYVK